MSNPTELPDLDRVHLLHSQEQDILLMANHHARGEDDGNYDFEAGGLLELVSRAIAQYGHLARRAQPEGEAPQAARQKMIPMLNEKGKQGWYFDGGDFYVDVELDQDGKYSVFFRDRENHQNAWLDQAAQHAESGAQATADERVDAIVTGLYRRFKDWSKRGFGADDVTWCEVKADVVALIAAQSQGAQAAGLDDIITMPRAQYVAERNECFRLGEIEGRDAAAQQAAAPGALESEMREQLARAILADLTPGRTDKLPIERVTANAATMRAAEIVRGHAAPTERVSAPGTPEAPKGGA